MKKAGGILGLIGGVFGVFAAIFTLFFGGLASAFSANGASTVVVLAWGGLAFSFLAIIFAAVCLGAQSRWPAAMLTAGSVLGAIFGGTFVALCMVLSLVGGVLALAGTRSEPGGAGGEGGPSVAGWRWSPSLQCWSSGEASMVRSPMYPRALRVPRRLPCSQLPPRRNSRSAIPSEARPSGSLWRRPR